MAATHGSSERDLVLRSDTDGMAMLGVHEEGPLMADVLRWQGTVLRHSATRARHSPWMRIFMRPSASLRMRSMRATVP